ncbi:thiamine pyrophosphate-dependent dehydrogenase E1 component subunit alpha [Microbacterium gorillae]|uniref:thiamine pyrophosphate-dependent dehydrogenase E1 component subunit alpha n=1 Tax=Microbacterium gorillae TaxID=1231063 RepID=UPI000591402E|nr:thiamine pyrophosphate-dependent dehydrogenase E1 component subunit alpha [Microbacterium gorillae]
MVYTLTPADDTDERLDDVARLIRPDGTRVSDPLLDAWVADVSVTELRGLYRDMVLQRRIDTEGFSLQRQGQLGLWAPSLGQEAAQIGTARALRPSDFVFPSYREIGVVRTRGATIEDIANTWRGEKNSSYDPYAINTATMQIIIGAQSLHAVGYAMGIRRDGADDIAVAYFGDGATSQGDVNEAMVFAASYNAPVVFVCQNNQWAISEPVGVQASAPIAGRAPGFGLAAMRVDGNDVLACLAAMRWAADHARTEGPVFLEAVTYRMGPHTTSDDPTRYRDADELEDWRRKDPIDRLAAHLRDIDPEFDAFAATVALDSDEVGAQMRGAVLNMKPRGAMEVFDHVYAEPHSGLERQKAEFAAYLAGFETEA